MDQDDDGMETEAEGGVPIWVVAIILGGVLIAFVIAWAVT